jgi:hypothetical protein
MSVFSPPLLATSPTEKYNTGCHKIYLSRHRTVMLKMVLFGFETWSPTLRDEHWLRVFENRLLRRISGPKRDQVRGEWRRLHNEEFNDLYSSPNIICVIKSRRMIWAGHVTCMGVKESAYKILVGETWRKDTTWKTQSQMGG